MAGCRLRLCFQTLSLLVRKPLWSRHKVKQYRFGLKARHCGLDVACRVSNTGGSEEGEDCYVGRGLGIDPFTRTSLQRGAWHERHVHSRNHALDAITRCVPHKQNQGPNTHLWMLQIPLSLLRFVSQSLEIQSRRWQKKSGRHCHTGSDEAGRLRQ